MKGIFKAEFQRPSIATVTLLFAGFLSVIVLAFGIYLQYRSSVQKFQGDLRAWQLEITEAFLANDWLSIRKIGANLDMSSFDSLQLRREKEIIFSAPMATQTHPHMICESFNIERYQMVLGDVEICASLSTIVFRPLKSPLFLSLAISFTLLFSLLSLIPLIRYKNDILKLIGRFRRWSEDPHLTKESFVSSASTKGQDPFEDLYEIVSQGLAQRLTSERLSLDLEKVEFMNQLAAQVAHDIRSPLMAIRLMMAQPGALEGERKEVVGLAAQRLGEIANDLLDQRKGHMAAAASVLAAVKETNKAAVSLTGLVKEIYLEKSYTLAPQNSIQLKLDISEGEDVKCHLDKVEFSRALSNIVNNAMEALDGEGEVILAVRGASSQVSVIVSDNGKGIPPEVLKKLGREQITHGKEGTQSGSGIGVWHACRAVEQMDGRFVVQSRVGVGTQVTMSFDRA